MGKSVRFGHSKCPPSADNLPRQRQKISKGFRNDGSGEMSPSNIGVGGVFTGVDEVLQGPEVTYRVEEVSIQYQNERDKQGKPTGPITEESVIYFRPTHVDLASICPKVINRLWDNRPRSYTRKIGGEVAEHLTNF
jgi:hypothetical protein